MLKSCGFVSMNYLEPTTEVLKTYTYDPPEGGHRFNGKLSSYRKEIFNARDIKEPSTLNSYGFELKHSPSKTSNFWEVEELKKHYFPESEELILQMTGAKSAFVFDHTLRRRSADKPELDGMGGSFSAVREPVGRVHADYTVTSGPERIRSLLGIGDNAELDLKKCAIYGLWRPINSNPLQDAPLALAANFSVHPNDKVPNKIIYQDRVGETYALMHNQKHEWYFFPHQTKDEVIVFWHFDGLAMIQSDFEIVNRTAPHTAIENPMPVLNAEPRESIELRVLALF